MRDRYGVACCHDCGTVLTKGAGTRQERDGRGRMVCRDRAGCQVRVDDRMATRDQTDPTLQPGRVDPATSRELATRVDAQVKQSYRNAVMALCGGFAPQGCLYAEGWVITELPLPIAHGWLETPDGGVLDPTLALLHSDEELAPFRYVVARRWSRQLVWQHIKNDNACLPILGGSGFSHLNQPWYQTAYHTAMRLTYGPAWDKLMRQVVDR